MRDFIGEYKAKKDAEKADMKKRNPDKLPTKFQVICRMVVGVYLLYLVYKMFKDGAIQNTSGGEKALIIASMIVFVVGGGLSFYSGLKTYKNGKFFDPNSDDFSEEAAEAAAEEEAEKAKEIEDVPANAEVRPGSMASFAKLTSAATVSEEEQDAAYEAAKAANEEENK